MSLMLCAYRSHDKRKATRTRAPVFIKLRLKTPAQQPMGLSVTTGWDEEKNSSREIDQHCEEIFAVVGLQLIVLISFPEEPAENGELFTER